MGPEGAPMFGPPGAGACEFMAGGCCPGPTGPSAVCGAEVPPPPWWPAPAFPLRPAGPLRPTGPPGRTWRGPPGEMPRAPAYPVPFGSIGSTGATGGPPWNPPGTGWAAVG